MRHSRLLKLFAILLLVAVHPTLSWAHGFVGQRFFPESMSIEDPFPSDEADLPAVSFIKGNEGTERSIGFEYSKRLTPNLALAVGFEHGAVSAADPNDPRLSGFKNPEFLLKYAMFRSPAHEAIVSASVAVSPPWGNRNAPDFEINPTIAPGLIFAKGLGDLPEGLRYLKPLAFGGAVEMETPLGNIQDPADLTSMLNYGFYLEYSLPYLQSFVKDIGLPKPFSRMVPIVELKLATPANGADPKTTTASLNPGVIWAGKYFQLGAEAQIPLNDLTGHNVGVIGVVHLYLDDIAPNFFTWTPFHGTLGSTQGRS